MKENYTWKLTDIFKRKEDFENEIKELNTTLEIIKKYQGKLKKDSQNIYNCYKNYEKALVDIHNTKEKFDVIYLDPPYETDFAEKSVKYIMENDLLNEEGIIILETDNKEKVYKNLEGYVANIYDERKYGRVHLIFLGRKG